MSADLGYYSHFAILGAALARSPVGAALEIGMGEGSSPMVHYANYGYTLSADTDPAWIAQYEGYNKPGVHDIECISDWRKWDGPERRQWNVAFIDCAPGEERYLLAIRLAKQAVYVICHDSERDYGAGGNYMYEQAKPHFRYVSEFRRWRPYTLIMSNYQPFIIEACDRVWVPATQ